MHDDKQAETAFLRQVMEQTERQIDKQIERKFALSDIIESGMMKVRKKNYSIRTLCTKYKKGNISKIDFEKQRTKLEEQRQSDRWDFGISSKNMLPIFGKDVQDKIIEFTRWDDKVTDVCVPTDAIPDQGYGLIKMLNNPIESQFYDVQKLLRGTDGIILFGKRLFYVSSTSKTVQEIKRNSINQFDFDKLSSCFANPYKLANSDESILIISLIGADQPWLDRQRAVVNAINDNISTLQANKDPFVIRALAEEKAAASK